jgi:UMF1 family MFS transporter
MNEKNPKPKLDTQSPDYERVVRAWAMYDWANSAFAVIILTAVFPVHYRALVTNAGGSPEAATAYWAYTTSISLLVVAFIGPALGALVDVIGFKKRFLAGALALGIVGSVGLAFLGQNTFVLASLIFAVANFGFAGGNIFYESLLPQVARADDLDRVSALGYALGYLGGGVLLVANAILLLWPEWLGLPGRDFALRACFVSVAIWWLVFSLPLFREVTEPIAAGHTTLSRSVVWSGLQRLVSTLREVRRYRQLAIFLTAFWLYNDGVSTIIKLAAAYGDEIGVRAHFNGRFFYPQRVAFLCACHCSGNGARRHAGAQPLAVRYHGAENAQHRVFRIFQHWRKSRRDNRTGNIRYGRPAHRQ